jgi:hypothetical protein
MVHLAAALRVCDALGREPSPEFLLGSLAPDAIHMRPGTGREDKSRVHLHRAIEADGLPAVRRLYDTLCGEQPDACDLALGYAVHLLTDVLWVEGVFMPFRAALMLPRDEERALYYRETDEVDRLLYVKSPWRPGVWRALAVARPADLPELLTAGEIDRWRNRTLSWFDALPAASVPPRYLTCERIEGFICEAATAIAAQVAGWAIVRGGTGA